MQTNELYERYQNETNVVGQSKSDISNEEVLEIYKENFDGGVNGMMFYYVQCSEEYSTTLKGNLLQKSMIVNLTDNSALRKMNEVSSRKGFYKWALRPRTLTPKLGVKANRNKYLVIGTL